MAHTMKEVAKLAGVSPSTVSRVLNKTQYISAETEKRVLEVVGKLNYYKNIHAKRLSTGQSDLFGLVISEITNPYFLEIIRGFQAAAWDAGFDVLLCNTEYQPQRAQSVLNKLVQNDVRGVAIMTSSIDDSMTDDLIENDIGIVFCNLHSAKLISNISIDYQRGVLEAIDHIVGLGHRHVAVIAGPETNRTAVNIKRALLSGLKRKGIDPTPVICTDYRLNSGASAVTAILSAPKRPTAIFCGSDLIAMGAMNALEDAGIRIPEDISIVGIDDLSFATLARPPLTTISVPREKLGVMAFDALVKMLRLKRRTGADYYLETKLVIRRSTLSHKKRS